MIRDDFKVVYEDLPTTIKAFIKETDGFYDIVLNSRMAYNQNVKSYDEEMWHIKNNDLDQDETVDRIETKSHRRSQS